MIVFVVAGVPAILALVRQAERRTLLAPVLLYVTQALWFVMPTALS
jgi:hypothetical protein